MVIAFVTMLLGLVAGPRAIEVAVGEPVVRVEMLLDGAAVGVLTGEPWKVEVDLGDELAPHRLVAVARDRQGDELGRTEQWLNLPRRAVEVQILLESETGQAPRTAKLIWSTAFAGAPETVSLTFDGEPLAVEDPRRIALPQYDPREPHFLRAELRFSATAQTVAGSDNVMVQEAVAEAAFGGGFGVEVATEMQALAVALRPGARLPPPAELSDWLRTTGEPPAVRAVDAGPADVVVVVDLAAQAVLQQLQESNLVRRPARRPRGARPDPNLPGYTPSPPPPRQHRSHTMERVPIPAGIRKDDHLRFVSPVASPDRQSQDPYLILPVSEPFTVEHGGLFEILARINLPVDRANSQRLADAVAVAGIQTYAGRRRRMVVLVVGREPVDVSRWSLPVVRRYLSRLRVPLAIWSVADLSCRLGESRHDSKRSATPGGALPDTRTLCASDLEGMTEISSIKQLRAAIEALRRQLDAQRILWVDGHHLPQQVELVGDASGIHWAGTRR